MKLDYPLHLDADGRWVHTWVRQSSIKTADMCMEKWRTDIFNFASQRAIERLGAKKDGVIRGNSLRRDGTIRDTVMYSLSKGEWPEVRAHLQYLLNRPL